MDIAAIGRAIEEWLEKGGYTQLSLLEGNAEAYTRLARHLSDLKANHTP